MESLVVDGAEASFDLAPGETVNIDVAFNANHTHEVTVYDGDVRIATLHSRQAERHMGLTNQTQRVKRLRIGDLYQDGSTESCGLFCTRYVWKKGAARLHTEQDMSATVGWEDRGDGDYNDAVVQIAVTPAPAPAANG